jgi:hypothetical protein
MALPTEAPAQSGANSRAWSTSLFASTLGSSSSQISPSARFGNALSRAVGHPTNKRRYQTPTSITILFFPDSSNFAQADRILFPINCPPNNAA